MKNYRWVLMVASTLLFVSTGFNVRAEDSDNDWQSAVTLYAWLPSVSGDLKYGGGDGSTVDAGDILDALNMTFMGALELRKNDWYLLTDIIYLDLDNSSTSAVSLPGGGSIVSDVEQELTGWQFGAYGGYRIYESNGSTLSLLAGLRYLAIEAEAKLDIQGPLPPELPARNFSKSEDLLDGVVGIRGQFAINDRWFVPVHADVGAGDSELTWQAVAGIGYRASWGETTVQYRHLVWDQGNDEFIQSLAFSGPGIGVRFQF